MKLVLIIFAAFLPCFYANWCNLPSCKGAEHVDCKMGDGQFADVCSADAIMLNLAPAQTVILDKHNTLRNKVAGGEVANLEGAVRMGTMQWNISLANLARRNVKKCTYTYDACMNTPQFDFVGQNIARAIYPKTDTRTNSAVILELIDLWFKEHEQATMDEIRVYPQNENPDTTSFAHMVRDFATRVGCAALTYTDEVNKILLLTCNYDMAPLVGWPVYIDGPTARDCQTGKNPNYPNLCSIDEQYNV